MTNKTPPSKNEPHPVQDKEALDAMFRADDVLPDAAAAFHFTVPPITEVIDDALVVLDTNTLLLPYGAPVNSTLTEITKKYQQIKKKKRLIIPAQVIREFIKLRPEKIGEIIKTINDKISRYTLEFPKMLILEDLEEYKKLDEISAQTQKIKKELGQAGEALREKIRTWQGNDPVYDAYKKIFSTDMIMEISFNREEVKKELQARYALKIPPGFEDRTKEDGGVGDFLIWKTILQLGNKHKKPLIFVSSDGKKDWRHQSEKEGFMLRYELQDEYRRASEGGVFYMVTLSEFLILLNANADSVSSIQRAEERLRLHEDENSLAKEAIRRAQADFHLQNLYKLKKPHLGSADPRIKSVYDAALSSYMKRISENLQEVHQEDAQYILISCPECDAEQFEQIPVHESWHISNCKNEDCGIKIMIEIKENGKIEVHAPF